MLDNAPAVRLPSLLVPNTLPGSESISLTIATAENGLLASSNPLCNCQATVVCRQAIQTGVEIGDHSFRDAWKHREIQRSDACIGRRGIC